MLEGTCPLCEIMRANESGISLAWADRGQQSGNSYPSSISMQGRLSEGSDQIVVLRTVMNLMPRPHQVNLYR